MILCICNLLRIQSIVQLNVQKPEGLPNLGVIVGAEESTDDKTRSNNSRGNKSQGGGGGRGGRDGRDGRDNRCVI
jgi:hypothetical protein